MLTSTSHPGPLCIRAWLPIILLAITTGAVSAQESETEWPEYDTLRTRHMSNDSARAACELAIASDSMDIDSWENLLGIAKREARYEDELRLGKEVTTVMPESPRAWIILADAYLDNGYIPEAVDALRRAVSLDSTSVRALTLMAEAWDLAEMSDSTLAYIDSALRLNPRNVQAHYQKADHLYRSGRRLEAVESYEAWATLQPFKPEPWVKLGEALTTVGLYEDAMDALRYALRLDPTSADAAFHLAVSLHGVGRTTEARDAFVEFFFSHPRHPLAAEAEQMARALGWTPGSN